MGNLPLGSQQVLLVELEGLLQPFGVVEESGMVAGPKLQLQEALPQKPKYSEPKPDPGTTFQAALVKTGQVGGGATDFELGMLTVVEKQQLGLARAAKLDTGVEMWGTSSVGLRTPSQNDLLSQHALHEKVRAEVEG